ncbi:MAG: ribonuclease P protein component [Gammaproteobacteria bacterium]|nr:ribonuclease P protein component [Gammaproteobacteria bacterium]
MRRAPAAPALGLPRSRRLRRSVEFQATARNGFKGRDALFIVTAAPNDNGPRIGVAVSRRVSTKAVTRNRIKRQIKESFRLHQQVLPRFDIVVVAQTAAAATANVELARSLHSHWQRLIRRCAAS